MKVRFGRKGAGGFSLVDLVFALAIVAVAILGIISMMLAIKARNESHSAARVALRACQEYMELILATQKAGIIDPATNQAKHFDAAGEPLWIKTFHDLPFQPLKLVKFDKKIDPAPEKDQYIDTVGANPYNCGRAFIKDISDPASPKTLYEISVWIDTTGLTEPPIKTRLVTRRSTFK